MELRDLVVTPIVIMLVLMGAYLVRPYVTDNINRRYFFPALLVKIVGALAVGVIYQFYYDDGDTFKYHSQGSRKMYEIMLNNPIDGFDLLFFGRNEWTDRYILDIPVMRDAPSFFVARIAYFFDLFTFSTYSSTAIFFALFSFLGSWFFFKTFYDIYPMFHRSIAISSFFIPSVFFWGSGILKDTITLACMGVAVYYTRRIFVEKVVSILNVALLVVSLYVIFSIKIYILLSFVPALILWVFSSNLVRIQTPILKVILLPIILILTIFFGYYSILKLGEGDNKYALDKLTVTANVTAYDIRYVTGRAAGSGYEMGEIDGSLTSVVRVLPEGINVSLFRPYLWEVKNPLMLLTACESFVLLILTLFVVFYRGRTFLKMIFEPNILFCFVFSISFAFAVGVSTLNFGTLSRYRIPLLPFYFLAIVLLLDYSKRDRKLSELDSIE